MDSLTHDWLMEMFFDPETFHFDTPGGDVGDLGFNFCDLGIHIGDLGVHLGHLGVHFGDPGVRNCDFGGSGWSPWRI